MEIQSDISLKPYNSFHLDCVAKYFVVISNPSEFLELMKASQFLDNERFVLGGGTNILLTKEGYEGIVIKNEIMGKEIIEQTDSFAVIKVGAGESRNEFVQWSIDEGYCGIENLVSIPGSVGAAPMQNIGAYGMEAKEAIESVDGIEYSNPKAPALKMRSNKDCSFGYRDSIYKQSLKNKIFITHVTFLLHKYQPKDYSPLISYGAIQEKLKGISPKKITPRLVADTISEIRASKLPDRKVIGTAGSFFKNPIVEHAKYEDLLSKNPTLNGHLHDPAANTYKLNAGQLIEMSGLKGITQGEVGTYKNHALVLVNNGGGTGQQLLDLAQHIQSRVHDAFGVQLESEVNLI